MLAEFASVLQAVNCAVEIQRELAERKRVEQALRVAYEDLKVKTNDLESATKELSQYDYIVAHVLKGPMRAIRNYADFIREHLKVTSDGDLKNDLDGKTKQIPSRDN